MPDAIAHAGLQGIARRRRHGLGEVQDGCLKLRVLLQKGERVCAAAAADVQERPSPAEIDAFGQQAGGTERPGMLGSAEGGPAHTSFGVQDAFIEAFVWEDPLPPQRLIEMPQALVEEAAIDDANVVAEVATATGNQVRCRRRRVGEATVLFGDQPDGLERRQKRPRTVCRQSHGFGDPGKRVRSTRDLREQDQA